MVALLNTVCFRDFQNNGFDQLKIVELFGPFLKLQEARWKEIITRFSQEIKLCGHIDQSSNPPSCNHFSPHGD